MEETYQQAVDLTYTFLLSSAQDLYTMQPVVSGSIEEWLELLSVMPRPLLGSSVFTDNPQRVKVQEVPQVLLFGTSATAPESR